tara:strand:- start:11938 stop:12456 length:519 start_codon:yes stop_codon:yes gene_type:complete
MSRLNATGDNLLCINGDFGEKVLSSGIIIPNDDAKESGVRSRWFQVFSVGPTIREKFGDNIKPGYWVIVKHGRWTPNIQLPIDDYRDQLSETIGVLPEDVDKHVSTGARYHKDFMFWKVDYHDGVLGYYPDTVLPESMYESQQLTSSLREDQRVYTAKQTAKQEVYTESGEV